MGSLLKEKGGGPPSVLT